ncbi:TPA: PTS lactose/cellobiose transporter subunit IIA [Streptococcus suis]
MYQETELEVIMSLIAYGGEAKSCAFEAITAAKEEDFTVAQSRIAQAEQALLQAHKVQTSLLSQEASGQEMKTGLLMIHGQDHLMTGICFVDLAKEIIALRKEIVENNKKERTD